MGGHSFGKLLKIGRRAYRPAILGEAPFALLLDHLHREAAVGRDVAAARL